MAKGSGSKMLYFVLYVVLITELMIVITERDELEEKEHAIREKMLASIANSYKQPVLLTATPKALDFDITNKDAGSAQITLTTVGLVSDEEKADVEFTVNVARGSQAPPGWPAGGISCKNPGKSANYKITNINGNGKLELKLTSSGEFNFVAKCTVERKLPGYLPDYLLDDLKTMIGEQKVAVSNDETFKVSAKAGSGVQRRGVEIL
ncbi:MAG: hypothetical protein HUU54_00520 [Ignavibacteriaceae bacterium]|nr:hypothetical protein [Ignavibacteriaceae bacterium]